METDHTLIIDTGVEYEKGRLTTHYPDITKGTGRLVERHLLETGQETKPNETTTW